MVTCNDIYPDYNDPSSYMNYKTGILQLVDIRNLSNPTVISTFSQDFRTSSSGSEPIIFDDTTTVLASKPYMYPMGASYIIDMSKKEGEILYVFPNLNYYWLTTDKKTLIASKMGYYYNDPISIYTYDVTNPKAPTVKSNTLPDFGSNAYDVRLSADQKTVIVFTYTDLFYVDVTDRNNPTLVRQVGHSYSPYSSPYTPYGDIDGTTVYFPKVDTFDMRSSTPTSNPYDTLVQNMGFGMACVYSKFWSSLFVLTEFGLGKVGLGPYSAAGFISFPVSPSSDPKAVRVSKNSQLVYVNAGSNFQIIRLELYEISRVSDFFKYTATAVGNTAVKSQYRIELSNDLSNVQSASVGDVVSNYYGLSQYNVMMLSNTAFSPGCSTPTSQGNFDSDLVYIGSMAFQSSYTKLIKTADFPTSGAATCNILATGPTNFVPNKEQTKAFSCCAYSFDISTPTSPSVIQDIGNATDGGSRQTILSFDEKTLYGVTNNSYLKIFDINNPAAMVLKAQIFLNGTLNRVAVSPDNKIVFVAEASKLMLLDISDLNKVTIVKNYAIAGITGLQYSSTGKTLYMTVQAPKGLSPLGFTVMNVSDPYFATVSSSVTTYGSKRFVLSADEKIAYVTDAQGVLVIDLSNLKAASVMQIFPLKKGTASSAPKNNSILASDSQGAWLFRYTPLTKYLSIDTREILLGRDVQVQISLSQLWTDQSGVNHQIPIAGSYKITKIQMMGFDASGAMKMKALPNWIIPDLDSGTLYINPTTPSALGSFYLIAGFSQVLVPGDFAGLGVTGITDAASAKDFFIKSAHKYVDSDLYLTAAFDPAVQMLIPSSFTAAEENSLRTTMGQKYIQALGSFSVTGSLFINAGQVVQVSTTSTNTISVTIQLADKNCRFVNKAYQSPAGFTIKSQQAIITGSLLDVNAALRELTVDFINITMQNGVALNYHHSEGNITASDNLNAPQTFSLKKFTSLLRMNTAPVIVQTVQSQIDKTSMWTAFPFSLQLNQTSIVDMENDKLTYTLKQQNGEDAPSWLVLNGLTLNGDPPNEAGIKLDLKIICSDGYKTVEDKFSVSVRISAGYVLSVFVKLIGPIVGALGAITQANQIYNILCKKRYTHSKIFKIKPNQPVTDHLIYPVELIGEETEEAKLIWQEWRTKVKKLKIPSKQKNPLVYFSTPEGLFDDAKLELEIADAWEKVKAKKKAEMVLKEDKEELSKRIRYRKKLDPKMMFQYLKDKLIMKKLELNSNTYTVFDYLSDTWGYVMEYDPNATSIADCYLLNIARFNKMLENHNLLDKADGYVKDQEGVLELKDILPGVQEGSKRKKKQKSDIKIKGKFDYKLLLEGMRAYIRSRSWLDTREEEIQTISGKMLVDDDCLGRLFNWAKLNIKPFSFTNKNAVGYGIKTQYKDGTIRFFGQTHAEIEGIMLVYQIKNLGGRILREIMIEGQLAEKEDEVPLAGKNEVVKPKDVAPAQAAPENINSGRLENKGAEVPREEADLFSNIDNSLPSS